MEAVEFQAFHFAVDGAHGFSGEHGMAPDERLMRAEESPALEAEREMMANRAACVMTLLTSICWQVQGLDEIRDRLAVVVMASGCMDLLPEGQVWHGRAQMSAARRALSMCPEVTWESAAGRAVVSLLTARGWEGRDVGYRALLLLYSFQRDKAMRPRMAWSLEAIGEAAGLTAANKRSAPSAAAKALVADCIRRMQVRSRGDGRDNFDLWFSKSRTCRSRLSVAMKGKRNRAGGRKQANNEQERQMR